MAQDVYPSLQDERIIRVERAGENNLQDIDVTIPRNRLVVITGVSGSGKSSLFVALFRIVELNSGTITIDGVDLST